MIKICVECSKEFTLTHGNQRCCSPECMITRTRNRNLMYTKKRYEDMTFVDKVALSGKIAIKKSLWTEEEKMQHRKYYRELMRKRRHDTTR